MSVDSLPCSLNLRSRCACESEGVASAYKALFSSMIDMIQYVGKKGKSARFFFGTNDFEYVWERLIDFNFGEDNKNFYFPRTSWYLGTEGKHAKSALEPDTIMREDDKVFILDAKYYRYGDSKDPTELPRSTSIHKSSHYFFRCFHHAYSTRPNNLYYCGKTTCFKKVLGCNPNEVFGSGPPKYTAR